MTTMTAARLHTGTSTVSLETLPIPRAAADEVVVRVEYAGICHSDLHFISGELAPRMPEKVTLGHEFSGVVSEVGMNATSWALGDRVVVHPVQVVNGITRILGVHYDGAWAQYVAAPASNVLSLGNDIPFDIAAIVPDAVATPWAAISDSAQVRPGESVALWGAGGLGVHAVRLLRMIGAGPIIAIDPSESARETALRSGADHVLDPSAGDFQRVLGGFTDGRGVDVAFDFFGHPSIHDQAFEATGPGGRIVLVGIPDSSLSIRSASDFIRLSKRVIGHYGSQAHHVEEILGFIRSGSLDLSSSITSVFPLREVDQALQNLQNKVDNPVRILLRP